MKLFLIGMPGSGKSTLGKQLANRLSMLFVDLDKEIEQQERKTIPVLFSTRGEPYFREKEKNVLTFFCNCSQDFVMATGGGTPCFPSNMKQIRTAGISCFLDVPVQELFCRLQRDQSVPRPLLCNKNSWLSAEKIAELYDQRLSWYKQADFMCSGSRINLDTILNNMPQRITKSC